MIYCIEILSTKNNDGPSKKYPILYRKKDKKDG